MSSVLRALATVFNGSGAFIFSKYIHIVQRHLLRFTTVECQQRGMPHFHIVLASEITDGQCHQAQHRPASSVLVITEHVC